jgi:hypothetical protein
MACENAAQVQVADSTLNEPQLGGIDAIPAVQNQPIYPWLD